MVKLCLFCGEGFHNDGLETALCLCWDWVISILSSDATHDQYIELSIFFTEEIFYCVYGLMCIAQSTLQESDSVVHMAPAAEVSLS